MLVATTSHRPASGGRSRAPAAARSCSRVSLNSTLERLSAIAGRPLDVHRTAREDGDVLHTGTDIARAREKVGYEPSTALEDGLRAEFEWALAARPAAIPSAAARS